MATNNPDPPRDAAANSPLPRRRDIAARTPSKRARTTAGGREAAVIADRPFSATAVGVFVWVVLLTRCCSYTSTALTSSTTTTSTSEPRIRPSSPSSLPSPGAVAAFQRIHQSTHRWGRRSHQPLHQHPSRQNDARTPSRTFSTPALHASSPRSGGRRAASATAVPDFDSQDPFVVLGLEASSALDLKEIKRAYKRLALRYHPDMVVNKDSSPEEKKVASDRFAKINWAYQVLSGKERRQSSPGGAGRSSASPTGAASGTGSTGWTPPHRRSGSPYSTPSSSQTGRPSTDWRDYIPYTQQDEEEYDTGGDSFGAIFRDLVAGAATGGRGIFTDFVEFLETNVDGYGSGSGSASGFGSASSSSSSSSYDDSQLRILLQTGTIGEVGDEMDDTDLVVQQLLTKQRKLEDELLDVQAEYNAATKYSQKFEYQERIDEIQARKRVVDGYIKQSRKRLLQLQTRYKELMVNGGGRGSEPRDDPKAGSTQNRGYGTTSSSGTWSSSTSSSPYDPSTRRSGAGAGQQQSQGDTGTGSSRHEDPDDAWKDDSFGSFGRGRGSSHRRRQTRGRPASGGSDRTTSSPAGTSGSGSSGSYASRGGTTSTNVGTGPRGTSAYRSSTGASATSSSSTSGRNAGSSTIPPHRRTSTASAPDYRNEQDNKRRLREVKVDEEFDKLKKELGL